ncbi:hypothetical protein GCK32_000420 [Trichostrongylus colubriformis]|uniref:Uncharacterized protein n=1 Tax=Trichostrongylus colubriformis TaxID=6319 RepID=A0AAN8J236_TRICO
MLPLSQIFSTSNFGDSHRHLFKAKFKFTVFNSRNEEIPTTVYTGNQQLHGYFEYIRRDLLISHVHPSDELQLVLNMTVTFDTVTRTSQAPKTLGPPEPKPAEGAALKGSKICLTKDLELIFKDVKLSNFTIGVGDIEIPVQKMSSENERLRTKFLKLVVPSMHEERYFHSGTED